MDNRGSIATLLADLDEMTPGGFALGLHIDFSGPTFLFQTFPHEWVEYYRETGLQLRDPAVHWAFANTGHIHWRELLDDDPADVIGKAKAAGLVYGVTICIVEQQSRSFGGFARADREYLDAEIADIEQCIRDLHKATFGLSVLSQEDMDALKKMSVRLSHS